MKIYQLSCNREPFIAAEVDRGLINFTAAFQAFNFINKNLTMMKLVTIADLLLLPDFSDDQMLRVFDFLESHNLWDQFLVTCESPVLAPIQRPRNIIAVGLNYAAHAAEGGREVPEEPIIFMKSGSIVIGPEEAIQIPPQVGRVDHELELAVIIGKMARHVPADDSEKYIAGYTIFNDVTARDMQKQDKAAQQPWFRSKNMETFGPMGPCLVTKKELGFPVNLAMELRVNGVVRQKASSGDMIYKIPKLLAYITQYLTLYPGDLISTGTPNGVSALQDGDVVEAEIERIGLLRNPVVQS